MSEAIESQYQNKNKNKYHLCKINAETDLSCDEFWNNGVSYKNQRESGFQLYAKMVSCYHYST